MTVKFESENTLLRVWLLLHRVRDAFFLCEDSVFADYGLTTEQFTLLAAVKGGGGSLRPSDLASYMERSPNSVSMLVDRMIKAGLVKRTRDRKDRRVVNVTLTGKGEKAVEQAAPADLGDAGKGPSKDWAFWTCYNSERATGKLEVTSTQNDRDYIAAVNWKNAEAAVAEGNFRMIGGVKVIDPKDAPGVVFLLPTAKSPHGVDVSSRSRGP